ncbi:MAG: hypothetical protein ACFBSC_18185 [Microcoleaceae cyanobacterium]
MNCKCAVYLSSVIALVSLNAPLSARAQTVQQSIAASIDSGISPILLEKPSKLSMNADTLTYQQPQFLSEINFEGISEQASDLISPQPSVGQIRIESEHFELSDVEFSPLSQATESAEPEEEDPRKAADDRGRRLSNNYNYFAPGVHVGLSGEGSGISEFGFATMSKNGYGENFSIHTSGILFTEQGASLIALTYDLPIRAETEAVLFSPFFGGGIIYRDLFDEDFSVGGLVMAGVDIPISYSFVFTGRANLGFIRGDTDLGLSFGVGYVYTKGLLDLIF